MIKLCKTGSMFMQVLLVTAAGTVALTNGCLSLKNAQEEQLLDIALQNRQYVYAGLVGHSSWYRGTGKRLLVFEECPRGSSA